MDPKDKKEIAGLEVRIAKLSRYKNGYKTLTSNIDLLITRFANVGAPDSRNKDVTKEMRDLYDVAENNIINAYKQIGTVVGKLSFKIDALESMIWNIKHK